MNELISEKNSVPKGWIKVVLKNLVENIQKINPRETSDKMYYYCDIDSINNSKLKITAPKQVIGSEAPSRARQLIKKHDILFSTVRTYLKNIAIVPDNLDGQLASTGFCVIRPTINHKFVFYYVQSKSFLDVLNNIQRGTSYPAVRNNDVLSTLIPLPPLNEQKRIGSKIESIFAQIDASKESLKKVQALIKQTIQVVLKQAFEGKLVQQDPNNELQSISYEEISHENTAKYSNRIKKINLPSRWTFCLFEDIVDFKNGINFTKNEKGIKGIPTIDVLNMYSESPYVSLDKVYKVNKKTNSDYVLKNGDLLFVRSSVKREGVGYTTLFKEVGKDITYCGFIIRARLLFKDILPMYLLYYFRYNKTRNEIIKSASQVTITNINQKTLGKIQIVLPPISEQRRIVTKIESIFGNIDSIEKQVNAAIRSLNTLKQSVLKLAFEGKLVPQDPNDEPASVLLEKIKLQKK